ncbi:MAG: type II secretion system protein GspK [Pseudomonadota bacterium]
MKSLSNQRASILIIVMWIISISLVLVSVLASNSKLSATIVMHQQDALKNWAELLTIINQAKMEVLFKPKTNPFANALKKARQNKDKLKKQPYLFNGQKIKLSYSNNEDMIVRIYDLSGKLNLSKLSRANFRKILVKKIGKEDKKIDELLDAWQDWTDRDSLKRLNGAEKDYYSKLEPAYAPRNSTIQSVNELSLIKGFREVFGNFDYSQVFSLYGPSRALINPNIVNRETLLLVPGIEEELADEIITKRKEMLFENMAEFNALIPATVAGKIKGWFALSKSRFYAIVIYPKTSEQDALIDKAGNTQLYAYKEIIQVLATNKMPKTLRVFPSYKVSL